jgi:hypothetical protein
MRTKRLSVVYIVFLLFMLGAVPVAIYHLVSGRYAQAAMAAGAAVVGFLLATRWLLQPAPLVEPAEAAAPRPVAAVRRPRPEETARREERPRGPLEGWLRNGILAGLIATAAMSVALVVAYVVVVSFADSQGGLLGRWFWNLAHNPITQAVGAAPLLTVLVQLVLGVAFAILYAGFAEPLLPGPGWRRGLLFSLALWLLSVIVFLPVMGGGVLGLALGAGPLPLLGNLLVHLVYGVVLGAVYAIPETAGLDRTDEDLASAIRADRGAAIGVVAGGIVGSVVGALLETLGGGTALLPPGSLILGGGVIGGAWGALLGSLAGLGGAIEAEPPGRVAGSEAMPR